PSSPNFYPLEIRARRSLAPPFMVQMRGIVETSHETSLGRDIALRCPHPRNSGRNRCAAARGADGAARRPYQRERFMASIHVQLGEVFPFHEPPLSPPCGERAGRGVLIWFMVPMRGQKRKEPTHEAH